MASRRRSGPPGNHRNYELVELQTLRDALGQTGNISSADRARPPAPGRRRPAAPACSPPSRASTRAPPTARSRRASRCDRWSAPSRSCCCPRSTASPPTPIARPSSSSPRAGRWAGCTVPAASPPQHRGRPGSCCSTRASGQDAEEVHAQALDLTLRRAGFRVLMLSNELGDERLERALRALDPTAIVLCGPGADTPRAVKLIRQIRDAGFDAPLFGFRATGLIGDAVPSAGEQPERGHRDAQRRPSPPRRPGVRLRQSGSLSFEAGARKSPRKNSPGAPPIV